MNNTDNNINEIKNKMNSMSTIERWMYLYQEYLSPSQNKEAIKDLIVDLINPYNILTDNGEMFNKIKSNIVNYISEVLPQINIEDNTQDIEELETYIFNNTGIMDYTRQVYLLIKEEIIDNEDEKEEYMEDFLMNLRTMYYIPSKTKQLEEGVRGPKIEHMNAIIDLMKQANRDETCNEHKEILKGLWEFRLLCRYLDTIKDDQGTDIPAIKDEYMDRILKDLGYDDSIIEWDDEEEIEEVPESNLMWKEF